MFEISPHNRLRLDPWAASSLLQKAIRRGEIALAQLAARAFRQHRGNAVWKRLITIAIEDVGIADVQLIWHVVSLGTDAALRGVLASDSDILDDLSRRLAKAPKDRSADYLYCAATKLPAALEERRDISIASSSEQIAIVCDPDQPLSKRASAILLACSGTKKGKQSINPGALGQLLDCFNPALPSALQNAMEQMALHGCHQFGLMLPLLWSRWQFIGPTWSVSHDDLAGTQLHGGVPLYAFDKHTAVGKRAVEALLGCSGPVRRTFEEGVPKPRWSEVAQMAAFYADGTPVARRFEWAAGRLLECIGTTADMTDAGCPLEAVYPILGCIRQNLPHLNELRVAALPRAFKSL